MSRTFLLLLVVAAVFAMASAQQRCGENEQYTTCGSACEPTCGQRRRPICTFECKIGCQCREGFLRNNQGRCVHPQRC